MARPGVTYLEVSSAAQQLTAAGRIPTIDSIRIALGSTGSKGTIGTHLRAWKTKQGQDQQIACKEKLPDVLIATMRGLWELVMNQSEEQVQAIRQKFQHDFMQLKHETERFQHENTKWQRQHQQIQEERDILSNERSSLEQQLISVKIELATVTEKHVGLGQQLKEKGARIDELHRQNQQIQANLSF
ncbi:MAG: DNA-binding protein [Oligoflexia bacterium]|nr:DNA-binding protein [Oligoflexia bacterium]